MSARIEPVERQKIPDALQPLVGAAESAMGFLSNDVLTMTKIPPVLKAMVELAPIMYQPGSVGLELKNLVTLMVSSSAGCYYCSSHQMLGSADAGVPDEKIEAIWEYPTSPLFSAAERAALQLAHHAGLTPNATTDDDFQLLRAHFSEEQILELVAVIAMFGFLNRWNDTLGTTLETEPAAVREKLNTVAITQRAPS